MRIRGRALLVALASYLVALHPAVTYAEATVTTVEHGPWAAAVSALQSDTSSQGSALSVCVRDEGAASCAPCGSYTLALDDAGRRAFAIGACDAASGTTRVSLVDRSALFEEGRVVPRPRAITIQASLVRAVASSGGAATTGGSTLGCTARLRPFLRDLEHGSVVALGPDRFRVVPRRAGIEVVQVGDGWMLSSEARIASEVDYDVVEIAGGDPVMHGHVSLECASETTTAASRPAPPAAPATPAPVEPTDYGATRSCSAVAVAPGQVLTNLPSVGYVNDGSADVVMVSSTFIADYASISWVGEIRNDRTTILCPEMSLAIDGAAPRPVPFVAEQHEVREWGGWMYPCLDPGEVAVAYQTYLGATLADVVRAGTVHYDVHDAAGVVPIHRDRGPRPTVGPARHVTTDGLDWYTARGTVEGVSVPIENVDVRVFPRDPCGLLGSELSAFPRTPVLSGAFSFTTMNGAPFDFRRSRAFVDYTRVARP